MFKKIVNILLVGSMTALILAGCGKSDDNSPVEGAPVVEAIPIETTEEVTPEPEPTPEPEETREGMYRSELTNDWIDEELRDQRPIAAMVDNERTALPHYGINQCDIVYEMMNSTANDRITRLMVIAKDWGSIERLGSIRSTRPTNFMVAAEYNAILCHDGGPFYNDQYYSKDYVNNLSGVFARISNGKATEFTEYITADTYTNETKGKTYKGIGDLIDDAKYDRNYNNFYPGTHFNFANKEFTLDEEADVIDAKEVELPFYHNGSQLKYNEETQTYDYYEYGEPHVDAADEKVTSFKNVILQGCTFTQLDENGYLIYNVIGTLDHGYYLTNGQAIPIFWGKEGETDITFFAKKSDKTLITLNTGKTYIAIIPDDTWDEVVLK